MKKANVDIEVTGRSWEIGCLLNQWVLFLSILLFLYPLHHYIERKSHLYILKFFFFSSRDLDVRKMASFVAKISDFNLNVKEAIRERL